MTWGRAYSVIIKINSINRKKLGGCEEILRRFSFVCLALTKTFLLKLFALF